MSNEPKSGTEESIWQRAQTWFRGLTGKGGSASMASESSEEVAEPCCGPDVHIAYRGKSDDRLYMAYNRRWQEVRYFQPNGIRVFCAKCRRRVY